MSIYDEIGGREAVAAAVDLFYVKVLGDPSLVPYFDGIELDRLRRHQRAFFAMALGGPSEHTGRAMGEAHAGLAITDEAFDAVAAHLAAALTELGVEPGTVETIIGAIAPLRADIVEVVTVD